MLALNAHLERNEPYEIEYRIRLTDGSVRWFRSRGQAVRDSGGKAVRMVGTVVDISERVEAERRLAQSEERFRAMFEKHAYPMWV